MLLPPFLCIINDVSFIIILKSLLQIAWDCKIFFFHNKTVTETLSVIDYTHRSVQYFVKDFTVIYLLFVLHIKLIFEKYPKSKIVDLFLTIILSSKVFDCLILDFIICINKYHTILIGAYKVYSLQRSSFWVFSVKLWSDPNLETQKACIWFCSCSHISHSMVIVIKCVCGVISGE
jgi:hypothetical protein